MLRNAITLKVNTRVMVQPCACLALQARVHLGMRSRLQASSWRVQWCSAISTFRQLTANASWDCNLYGKSTAMLISNSSNLCLAIYHNNWWLHVPYYIRPCLQICSHARGLHCADALHIPTFSSKCNKFCRVLISTQLATPVYQARPISLAHWKLSTAQLQLPVSERNWSSLIDY